MEMVPALDGAELFGNYYFNPDVKEKRKDMIRAAKLQPEKFRFFAWLYDESIKKASQNAIKSGDVNVKVDNNVNAASAADDKIKLKPTKSALFTQLFFNKFKNGAKSEKANGEGFTVEQEAKEEPVNTFTEETAKVIPAETVVTAPAKPVELEKVASIFNEKAPVEQMAAAPAVKKTAPLVIAQEPVKVEEIKPIEPIKAPAMEFAPETAKVAEPVVKQVEQARPIMEPFSSVSIGTPVVTNEVPTADDVLAEVIKMPQRIQELEAQHAKDIEQITTLKLALKDQDAKLNAASFEVNTAHRENASLKNENKRMSLQIAELQKQSADIKISTQQQISTVREEVERVAGERVAKSEAKYDQLVRTLAGYVRPNATSVPVENTTQVKIAA